MKVILLQDVAKVGRRFETVEVPNGYALNRLIPSGMAETATPENRQRLKMQVDLAEASMEADTERFDGAAASLQSKVIEVKAELNEQGHMFEALKPAAVAEGLKAAGIAVDEGAVHITAPIKEAGEHSVTLVGPEGKTVEFTINVSGK